MGLEPMVPRKDQEDAIQDTLRDGSHLCMGDKGSGKTLIGVEAALRSGAQRVLVVGPLNTFYGWKKTFERQSRGQRTVRRIDSLKAGKQAFEDLALGKPGVYHMGWERFRMYDWRTFDIDMLIADEVHAASNRKAQTTKALWSAHAQCRLGLSATPAGNSLQGLWSVSKWLWPNHFPAFWTFVTKYLTKEPDPYTHFKIGPEKNPGAVWDSLPSKSAFPTPYQEKPIVYEIGVDLTPAQRRIYDRFEKEAVVWLDENPLIAELPAVQMMRLRQIALAVPSIRTREDGTEEVYFEEDAKSTKADAVLEVLADLYVAEPEPVLIFTHSRKYAEMLAKRLQSKGYRARMFVGGMNAEERRWKLANFGKEYDVLVATIAAIGTGTDGLQDVCRIEMWMSLDDNRILNEQAKGRLSRPGQKRTVLRYLFMANNTVEQRQLGRIEADQAQLDLSLNYAQKEAA